MGESDKRSPWDTDLDWESVTSAASKIKPFAEIAGLIAVAAIPMFVIKIIVVAGADLTVALAILTNISLSGIAVAVLATAVPWVVIGALTFLSPRIGLGWGIGHRMWRPTAAIVLLFGLTLYISNTLLTVAFLGAIVFLSLIGFMRGREFRKDNPKPKLSLRLSWSDTAA